MSRRRRTLTDSQTLKDSASTQLLIKYKSEALVTESDKPLVF